MDRARWQRIEEIFAAALAEPLAARAAFLDSRCADDAELRREVESLLTHHREDDFLQLPVAPEAMRLLGEAEAESLIGKRLGRFEVLGRLGAGGMGEVYLAHDPTLERRVSLKLLPPHLAGDPEGVRRFRREALAVSALNHPNILIVHDIVDVEGRQLLVGELIEGVTLRERLRQGAMPVAAALDLAAQVARGLAAAHGLGIVHRDVKPENLMIRKDGLVKLLDFGIAKRPPPRAEGAHLGPSPTDALTGRGTVLGTASYMSPEQARGEPAGRQTDIWALGCVLYEALTGRKAFPGDTPTDVIAAVVGREPDLDALPADTPWLARSVLRRCLEKSTAQRLQDVGDVRIELEEAMREPAILAAAGDGRRRSRWLPWAVAAVATVAALGLAATLARQPARAPAPATAFELAHPADGRFFHSPESATLALSPDGSQLGFVSAGSQGISIWVRPLAELGARPVPGTEGATSLFWSPDGQSLGFVADGKLKRVPQAGGSPIVLCEVEAGAGVNGTWGRDSILFATLPGNAIYRLAAEGGAPTVALRADASRDEQRLGWPWYLPDGERFLYLVARLDGTFELRLADPRGETRTVAPMASRVELVDPGLAVFAREGALLAQRFDPDRARLFGTPIALAPAVRTFGTTGAAAFATARNGTVVLATQNDLHRIALVDRDGQAVGTIGSAVTSNSLAVSPDGRRAIADRMRPGLATQDLWILDVERGVETRLTDEPGTEVFARWLPDGRSIVYSATRGGAPNLRRRDLASGRDEELVPPSPFQMAVAVTPDGRQLLFRQRTATGFDLLAAPLAGSGRPAPVLRPGVSVLDASLSSDGRLLAYVSPEAGRGELFVRFLQGGESVRVSADGAGTARFAPDGETLFFTTLDRRLAAVRVASTPALAVGRPAVRFELPALGWRDFSVLPDGRFLALQREVDGATAPLTVITGWNAALGR